MVELLDVSESGGKQKSGPPAVGVKQFTFASRYPSQGRNRDEPPLYGKWNSSCTDIKKAPIAGEPCGLAKYVTA
jgi:hypothetical protein